MRLSAIHEGVLCARGLELCAMHSLDQRRSGVVVRSTPERRRSWLEALAGLADATLAPGTG